MGSHEECCDYEEFLDCMGGVKEGDPNYEFRKSECEHLHCDIVCLEEGGD